MSPLVGLEPRSCWAGGRQELPRRYHSVPKTVAVPGALVVLWTFAVPYKIFGLTLILDFIDRCTQSAPPPPATGSGAALWLPPSLRAVGKAADRYSVVH